MSLNSNHTSTSSNHTATVAAAPARGVDINAETGLCTDYLNHFNEVIMALEMLPLVPEVMDEFIAWQPRTYREHFAASNFRNRDAVLAAYQAADPAMRNSLDALAEGMNETLHNTRNVITNSKSAGETGAIALSAAVRLKALVAEAGMVINGRTSENGDRSKAETPQAAVDKLLSR